MPLTRPFPVDKGLPNPVDVRRELAGILPREGVLPTPTLVASGLGYKGAGWNVGARPFVACVRRREADFSLSGYGSALVANTANDATAWLIPGAPTSGSRIDLLWIKVADPTQGDALSTPSGEAAERAVPTFGVTSGVAATSPTRPALPAGVLEVVEVTTPAGAASIAGSTLRQSHRYASTVGGAMLVATAADLPSDGLVGERAVALDTGARHVRTKTAWRREVQWDHQQNGSNADLFADPPAGTEPILKTGYMRNFSDESGRVTVTFESPFPTRCLHVSITPIEGTTSAGVVDGRAMDDDGFTTRFAGLNGGVVAFTYLAVGY